MQTGAGQDGTVRIITEGGPALAEVDGDGTAARFLLLTHGAGGSAGAPDLLAARDAARALGGLVARVTQPYRVRGARAPGSPVRQDAAWAEVVTALRELAPAVPLIQGGRSAGVPAVPAGALTRGVQGRGTSRGPGGRSEGAGGERRS